MRPSEPTAMPTPHTTAASFLRHGLIVVAFNTVIALVQGLYTGHPAQAMVYSQSIGLIIWACIDFGRYAFQRDERSGWPLGWRRWLLIAVGIAAGYVGGTLIGDAYAGCSTLQLARNSPRQALAALFLSLSVSSAIVYYFFSHGRSRALEQLTATAQRDAAENQLKLLASQLEPHMLFNTLANLRVLISADPERAQLMLDHLVGFLRATLGASRHMLHPLSVELARVADYLALMKIRMGERLRTELVCPAELADLAVPTLLLQPLVENAIKHGLEPHVDGGRLIVSASREGSDLVLRVRDTGVGLSTVANDGTHFGVTQVRERLATLYGDTALLAVTPAGDAEGGTLATVRIPLNQAA